MKFLIHQYLSKDFCLRFADDFHLTYDDWKPEKMNEFVMNALVVPNGTFELCSRTDNRKESMLPRHMSAVGIVSYFLLFLIIMQVDFQSE